MASIKDMVGPLLAGDNVSKLIGVGLIIITSTNFFQTRNQGNETREEIDRQAAITRAQVRETYHYQLYFLQMVRGLKADHSKLLQNFGLGSSEIPDPPEVRPMPYDGK
jgi:hypothetical protein